MVSSIGSPRRLWLFLILGSQVASQAGPAELTGGIDVAVKDGEAGIHWNTNVPTGTRAEVTPSAIVTLPANVAPSIDHRVTVAGLRDGVNYTIRVGTARLWLGTRDFSNQRAAETIVSPSPPPTVARLPTASPARQTWAHPVSLPDHFNRHGADFGAKNPEDYARLAWEFLQRARVESYPAKVDSTGTLRIFDPNTGTFAAYNRDGMTKTFFKPGRPGYFERQPGSPINLRTWR